MTKNNWLIPSLIFIGAISVILSIIIASNTEKTPVSARPLARIELNLGRVYILRNSLTRKEVLTQRSRVFALDSIETAADGDATLEFDSSYRVRISENSLITIDEEKNRIVLIIKRGDLQVENHGREGALFISRNGVRYNATDYEVNYKALSEETQLPDLEVSEDSAVAKNSEQNEKGNSISADYIQETLKTHRNSFFKCYTQLLQKTPGVTGSASISFTIEKNGRVHKANVANSTLQDQNFKNCLIEAIRRVEFKTFNVDPITTVFPLRFE